MQSTKPSSLTFIALLIFIVISCKDNPNDIGLGILPSSDKMTVMYVDTINVYSSAQLYTKDIDSASNSDIVSLGSLNDPVFGHTDCELLNEIRLTGYDQDNKPKIGDSLVLQLRYYKLIGLIVHRVGL